MTLSLAEFLGVDQDFPVKEQVNRWCWFSGFILIGTINFVLACILVSCLIAKFKGWSYQQTIDYFWRYENFPRHWYKR